MPARVKLIISLAGLVWAVITLAVNSAPPGQVKKLAASGQITGAVKAQLAKATQDEIANKKTPPPPGAMPTPPLTGFGALIAGVTAQERADWLAGRAQFQAVETPATGLGPLFNQQSCQACHGQPNVNGKDTIGGAAGNLEAHFVSPGFGTGQSDLFHLSSLSPASQDVIPSDITALAVRKSNQTFGLGLIEEISDADIIANAQHGEDGVFGRAAMLNDPVTQVAGPNRVGRFGWKAQEASTIAFAADGLINELGLTNRFFSTDIAPHMVNGFAILTAAEPPGITPTSLQDLPSDPTQPESETNPDRVEKLHDFMRFNAAPPTVPLSASALRGQKTFDRIGCTRCHTPSYRTGPAGGSIALGFRPVNLYSDLRLHHCGPVLGDGIPQGNAGPDEMRTAPLWGLRARTTFLHDGSAASVQAAIEAHDAPGAESQKIAQRFNQLPAAQQAEVLAFLNSI